MAVVPVQAAQTAATITLMPNIAPLYSGAVSAAFLRADANPTQYLMRAYDPDNSRFCYWQTTDITATPSATFPSAIVANLLHKRVML